MLPLRDFLTYYFEDPECYRLSEHQVYERLALLLSLSRIVVTVQEQRTTASPTPKVPATAPAFPLSERSPVQPQTYYQPRLALSESPRYNGLPRLVLLDHKVLRRIGMATESASM
jgi:hypothetical protein